MTLAATLRPVYLSEERRMGRRLRDPVMVDDNADQRFLGCGAARLRRYPLRHPARRGETTAAHFRGSKADELVQLADVVCGSVAAMLDGEDRQYMRLVSGCGVGCDTGHGAGVTVM